VAHGIEGILFDLDGTLLQIDINELIGDYFSALAPVIAPILGVDEKTAMALVGGGVEAMIEPHEGTNQEVFDAFLREHTGVDLGEEANRRTIEDFYREVFPTLQGSARPVEGAREAIEATQSRGLPIAIATHPIFPALATKARLEWAGLGDLDLPVVSSYENSSSTKPHPSYFEEMAQRIGVDPPNCVMIGDDPVLDMSAAQTGMMTFFVGENPDVEATWRGTLADFIALLD
jgi:HAD superfamily hydrolase (TIGR01549 family)